MRESEIVTNYVIRKDDKLELRHTLEGHQLGVVSVDVNQQGTMAASSSLNSHVRLWDVEAGKQSKFIDAGPGIRRWDCTIIDVWINIVD